MDKGSIVVGITQLALIILIWIANPSAMVEQMSKLLLVFGIGCVTGLIAPSMLTFTKNEGILSLAIVFEILYVASFGILWGVVQYNIVI